MRPLRVGMVAGEASGDVLAAGLVKAIRKRFPDAIIEGIGGQHMQAQGFHSLFDMETLSVMGLVEVLGRLPSILKLKRQLLDHFADNPPDVFVGIDAPDFNLRIETELKARGIPTVHYVSPTIWAWRENRIHKIAKATNLVLGVFPFEQQVYDKYSVPFKFVGHTLADEIDLQPNKLEARKQLGLDENLSYLGILPGSRRREVATLLPIFICTMGRIFEQRPNTRFVIPAANDIRYKEINDMLDDVSLCPLSLREAITVTSGNSRQVMVASDVLLLASGTAALEGMLCKRPMVVGYKMSRMTYRIMQRLYKPDYFSLPNILADQLLIPELLQDDVNAEHLASLLLPMMDQDHQALQQTFIDLHQTLRCNADDTAADAVLALVAEK